MPHHYCLNPDWLLSSAIVKVDHDAEFKELERVNLRERFVIRGPEIVPQVGKGSGLTCNC